STAGLSWYSLAIFLHILLFVYWLGGDLGVFYAARFITDPSVALPGRNIATRIMHVVDMSPRICLVLFLPSGVTLMALDDLGRDIFLGWPLVVVWLAGLAWLALVIMDFRKSPERYAALVGRLDFAIRSILVVALLGVAAYAFVVAQPFGVDSNPKWLAGKVAAYAICIFGGLMIRVRLRPFGPAFAALQQGSTPEIERTLTRSIQGSLPFVYLVWAMVLLAAFLGVVKPGTTAF
ncbi:MAG: hypothetical protein ABIP45_04925, partial [Knoellia sp.]